MAVVDLTTGPQRAAAHTLDLHVVGEPPLALLAEPAGAPQNGRFPLRLRPLYPAQTEHLIALLRSDVGDDPRTDVRAELADPALYESACADRITDLVRRQGLLERDIAALEAEWLDAHAALDAAESA